MLCRHCKYIVINSIERHNPGGIRLAVKGGDGKAVSGYKWLTKCHFAQTMFTIINSALFISVSSKPFHFQIIIFKRALFHPI